MKITFEKHEVEYILELLKKHICDCYLEKEWNNACTASTIKYFEKEIGIGGKIYQKLKN